MKCYVVSMVQSTVGFLSFLACVVSSRAARYGDYSMAYMPQYEDRLEGGQGDDFMLGMEDYNKSPDAPARLDYKYEEEQHEKSDNRAIKDIDEEKIWDKPRKKIRKLFTSRSNRNLNLDNNSFNIESRNENDGFYRRRSNFRNNDFEMESDRGLKHKLVNRNDDLDNIIEGKNYFIQKDDVDGIDRIGEFEDDSQLRHRSATQKKVRRKPRDRSLHQPEMTRGKKHLQIEEEEIDARRARDRYSGSISARDPVPRTDLEIRKPIKQAHDYDYGGFYDMNRVHNIKNRLPALLRQKTVRTMEPQTIRFLENRKRFEHRDDSTIETTNENDPSLTTTSSLDTSPLNASITTTSIETERRIVNTSNSDLSLAEKSRLSISNKALNKESGRNVSINTKPPVLMQVTRKMQTVVVVEPQPQAGRRARVVSEESPARLRRARRLMRHKLVAAARSIHDLTENWDELVCDYIDVSLLDADAARTFNRLDFSLTTICILPFVQYFSW